MAIILEQLIQNRKNLIETFRINNFTDGIHALLTDLYPDTAHFIYELLQNAEDMDATVVRFILDHNGIDFEHNGTKRAFNIADIDAITNIGHNGQKKDDKTSIGKFGVGFKAVFAYTATPTIHSGDYHFEIRDYFVPNFEGVRKVSTVDPDGVVWTKFSFPFNNPKKPPQVAFKQCLDGLHALDASAILFLRNIRKIEYMLPSSEIFGVECTEDESHRVTITQSRPGVQKIITRWLRFQRLANIIDDQGNPKQLSTGVAFALKYDDQAKKDRIICPESGGRTFIYFPAEKEYSGLRFHINAPFASTVARDSVRDCPDNKILIKAVSRLLVDSLPIIKEQGLMNHAFFEVLPNDRDGLSAFYQCFFEDIYGAFLRNAYLPVRGGGWISSLNALMGKVSIANVLKGEILKTLAGTSKTWIVNASQRNSHADHFLRSLGIQIYTHENFAQIFNSSVRSKTERVLSESETEWLKQFYLLCAEMYDDFGYQHRSDFVQDMKLTAMIRSSRGRMYKSGDIYIMPSNGKIVPEEAPIIAESILQNSSKTVHTSNRIKEFFEKYLGVQEYSSKIEIEKTLRKWANGITIDTQYYRSMLIFARYAEKHSDIDFASKALFLYLDNSDNKLHFAKASELYLGSAYDNPDGDILSSVCGGHCLWSGYKEPERYNQRSIATIVAFAKRCGIKDGLTIEKQLSYYHPAFYSELHVEGRETDYCVRDDYTIPNLEKLLKKRSLEISKLIWRCLEKHQPNYSHDYTIARYSPNNSSPTKFCDSTLIYWLKRYEWIPDKQGKLHKPEDIRIDELAIGFNYDPHNRMFDALKIGSIEAQKAKEKSKLEEDAEKMGYRVVPKDEYREFQSWKKQQRERVDPPERSARELFDKQQRQSSSTSRSKGEESRARREEDIEQTWRESKRVKPAVKKVFSRIVESTDEEKEKLRTWYQGRCQMCHTVIIGCDQKPHFIARNIISTRDLTEHIRRTTSVAWNSLCLCPNCATRYQVCSKDLSMLYNQIISRKTGVSEKLITLSFVLDGKQRWIDFNLEHFLALRKAILLINEEFEK